MTNVFAIRSSASVFSPSLMASLPTLMTDPEIAALRDQHYNATVASLTRLHDELMVVRVKLDSGTPKFIPGQYTVLGLGYWEPRVADCQEEPELGPKIRKVVKRAYSISCSMLAETGADSAPKVVSVGDCDYLEFYITLVRKAEKRAPALTPRLFALEPGDRVFCADHVHGHYTLDSIPVDADVVFAGTGTGEAPHNAMVAELLARGHRGRVVNATCVRFKKDLGYLGTHRRLEELRPNYHYIALTTREPENLDESRADFVGKQYLQDYLGSSKLRAETGVELDPANTHVFLCGNPAMIGVPLHSGVSQHQYPTPVGMVEILESRGFEMDRPRHRGNIHFEKYW